jgi:hypothetical protein
MPSAESACPISKSVVLVPCSKANLRSPARVWTKNALYQACYAKLLLKDDVPQASVDDPGLRKDLLAASGQALAAVSDYEQWMRRELLPRSTRSPAWTPQQIDFYQSVHEQLPEYTVDEMLRIARKSAPSWRRCRRSPGRSTRRVISAGCGSS